MIASRPFSRSMAELNVHRTSKATCLDAPDRKAMPISSLPVRTSADSLTRSHSPTNGVGVTVGVFVGSGVGVIVGVAVGGGVGVIVGVSVGSGVAVGVSVGSGVGVAVGVSVGNGVGVIVGVSVGGGVGVTVGSGVLVAVDAAIST